MTSDWWRFDEEPENSSDEMTAALKAHWPEYLMEATGLGVFMISACVFGVLLFHPSSPITQIIAGDTARRVLMGVAMGTTAVAIIFSPFGKRSGAHINPAVTLTFFRLGKIEPWDAAFYTLFQFIGGFAGVLVSAFFLGSLIADRSVNYVVTIPGPGGPAVAFLAEMTISFILMLVILTVSNTKRLGRWTGLWPFALSPGMFVLHDKKSHWDNRLSDDEETIYTRNKGDNEE